MALRVVRARVVAAGGDADDAGERHLRRREHRIAHRALALLALAVAAPAPDGFVDGERAGVVGARRDADDGGETGDLRRGGAVGLGAVAELAELVGAPAEDVALRRAQARVRLAGRDLLIVGDLGVADFDDRGVEAGGEDAALGVEAGVEAVVAAVGGDGL